MPRPMSIVPTLRTQSRRETKSIAKPTVISGSAASGTLRKMTRSNMAMITKV